MVGCGYHIYKVGYNYSSQQKKIIFINVILILLVKVVYIMVIIDMPSIAFIYFDWAFIHATILFIWGKGVWTLDKSEENGYRSLQLALMYLPQVMVFECFQVLAHFAHMNKGKWTNLLRYIIKVQGFLKMEKLSHKSNN